MNFSPKTVNHRFITYSDSLLSLLVFFRKSADRRRITPVLMFQIRKGPEPLKIPPLHMHPALKSPSAFKTTFFIVQYNLMEDLKLLLIDRLKSKGMDPSLIPTIGSGPGYLDRSCVFC